MRKYLTVATLQLHTHTHGDIGNLDQTDNCSLVARLILHILLNVLSSFLSASFGLKSPINLPRNRLRSPPSRLVLRSPGFNNFENGKHTSTQLEERIA